MNCLESLKNHFRLHRGRFNLRLRYVVPILLTILVATQCWGGKRQQPDSIGPHEITVYVIAPAAPIRWESPSSLYKSVKQSYIKRMFQPKKRFLGHMFFRLQTTLLKEPLWLGIAPDDNKQMLQQLFVKKVGLGILGVPFKAKLENKNLLESAIKFHSRHKKVMFVRLRIREEAAKRILSFLTEFHKKVNDKYAPSDFYGGVFWPLYKYEGSGCSALCLASLQAGGIWLDGQEDMIAKCRIQTSLVGGDFNNGRKVRLKSIKKADSWFTGQGDADNDYIDFEIYDPALVLNWIKKRRANTNDQYQSVTHDNIPGLVVNCIDYDVPDTPLKFEKRPNPSVFINHHLSKMTGSEN